MAMPIAPAAAGTHTIGRFEVVSAVGTRLHVSPSQRLDEFENDITNRRNHDQQGWNADEKRDISAHILGVLFHLHEHGYRARRHPCQGRADKKEDDRPEESGPFGSWAPAAVWATDCVAF
jgi:hypothetical protein